MTMTIELDIFKLYPLIEKYSYSVARHFGVLADREDLVQDVASAFYRERETLAMKIEDDVMLCKVVQAQLRREARKYFDHNYFKLDVYCYSKEFVVKNWLAFSSASPDLIDDLHPDIAPGIRGIDLLADFDTAISKMTDKQRQDLALPELALSEGRAMHPKERSSWHRAVDKLVWHLNRGQSFVPRFTQHQEDN